MANGPSYARWAVELYSIGMIEYPQGATGAMPEAGQSACCVVYVLERELQMNSGGMHEVLGMGDSACVDSDMAIAWSAGATGHCRALVVTRGGEPES